VLLSHSLPSRAVQLAVSKEQHSSICATNYDTDFGSLINTVSTNYVASMCKMNVNVTSKASHMQT